MSDLKNLFVPYELAVKLKEKGFNEPCFAVIYQDNNLMFGSTDWTEIMIKNYSDDPDMPCVKSPLLQQVIDWLRETHSIHIEPKYSRCKNDTDIEWWFYLYPNYPTGGRIKYFPNEIGEGLKHPEALNKAIEEAFKLIKK